MVGKVHPMSAATIHLLPHFYPPGAAQVYLYALWQIGEGPYMTGCKL